MFNKNIFFKIRLTSLVGRGSARNKVDTETRLVNHLHPDLLLPNKTNIKASVATQTSELSGVEVLF